MTDVIVEYSTGNGNIEIYGKTVWCRSNVMVVGNDHEESAYLLGVEILSPMTLFSLLQQHTARLA